eukprot:TRINITY_DN31251_c0_g1_i3.p1 TRINITY_DN31251_c0_g1~~TRINITY_DN31251_c0_g1_i3.p1  ORF type:complete len:217 (+),score=49.27 TRINITY_DN31251_c0_g1_i3:317-967(+)
MFICAFALFQGNAAAVQKQLGNSLADAPFMKALKSSKYFLVMRNSTVDLYERGWCICEIIYASQLGFFDEKADQVFVAGPDTFAESQISCLDMKTSQIEDKGRIMEALVQMGSYKRIDDLVKQFRTFHAGDTTGRLTRASTSFHLHLDLSGAQCQNVTVQIGAPGSPGTSNEEKAWEMPVPIEVSDRCFPPETWREMEASLEAGLGSSVKSTKTSL